MTTKKLEKAVREGTVPCYVCRKEQKPDALRKGRCVNRAACQKRIAASMGRLPRLTSFPRPPGRSGWKKPTFAEKQTFAYQLVMEEQRERRRIDLVVV